MPEDLEPFEVAIVFNGYHPPRVLIFKGKTGREAMQRATNHLEEKTSCRCKGEGIWKGPNGEAVITPFINKIEC